MKKIIKCIIACMLLFTTLFNLIVPNQIVFASDDNKKDEDYAKLQELLSDYHVIQINESAKQESGLLCTSVKLYELDRLDTEIGIREVYEQSNQLITDFGFESGYYYYDIEPSAGFFVDRYILVKNDDWDNLMCGWISSEKYDSDDRSFSEGPFKVEKSDIISDLGSGEENINQLDEEYYGGIKSENDNASLFERLVTIFFITIGTGALWAIGAIAGGTITLDSLIFNEYSNTNLAFFKDSNYYASNPNPFISSGGVLEVLGNIYNLFVSIAVAVLLTSLLYVGLRILIDSTGAKKAKYKGYIVAWVQGVLILFLFPIVMRIMIDVNYALVADIRNLGSSVISGNNVMPSLEKMPFANLETTIEFGGQRKAKTTNYMDKLREDAWKTGRVMYAICWLILITEIIKFFFIYFKRMLITLFLIAVFPLVTLTYVIDKMGDGKSQAFSSWFKEFMLNVFLQSFHAINYTIVMALISASTGLISASSSDPAMGSANFILVLIGITYVANGDNILRSIFGQTGGAGSVKSAAETIFKTSATVNIAKKAAKGISGARKRISGYADKYRGISDRNLRLKEDRLNREEEDFMRNNPHGPSLAALEQPLDDDMRNRIDEDANILANNLETPNAIRDALDRMDEYLKDPAARERLLDDLRNKGLSDGEIKSIFRQNRAAKDVNVKNNIDVLVNRKKDPSSSRLYNSLSDKLLSSYGLTDKMIEDKAAAQKNINKFENGINKSNKKIAARRGGRRTTAGGNGNVNGGTSDTSSNGAFGEGLAGGMTGEIISNRGLSGARANIGKLDKSKVAGKKISLTKPKNHGGKKSSASEPNDPIRKTYYDSENDVKGTKRTAQQKRTRQKINAIRREQAIAKQKEKIEGKATSIDSDSTRRVHYSYAASIIAEANSGDATRVEQISALMEAKKELDSAKQSVLKSADEVQKEATNNAVQAMEEQMNIDDSIKKSIERIQKDADRIRNGRAVSAQEETKIYEVAMARETLRVGEGTFDELWDAYHTCINNSSVAPVSDAVKINGLALSVATINSHDEITGNNSQNIINEAIANIKSYESDGGIYGEIIDNLKYDPSTLNAGERPSTLKPNDNPIHMEPTTASDLRKKMAERAEERDKKYQQYEDSIYNVNKKSFDAEKEKEKRNKEAIRLSLDIGKEILRDSAAIVGAANSFSAYAAIGDEKMDTTKVMAAVTLGSTAGTKIVDTGEYYAHEAINVAKNIKKGLEENREGRNPIRLHGKKK